MISLYADHTDSSRGIGRQIALGLAQQNCNVIIHGREITNTLETLRLLADYDIETQAIAGDLGTEQGIQAVIQGVKASCQRQLDLPMATIRNTHG